MKPHRHYPHEGTNLNVLIADDNPVERAGIKSILKDKSQINIVGETGCGPEALDFLQQRQCDLVVADINTSDHLSLKIIEDLKKIHPKISILALGPYDEVKDVAPLLRAGANGYFRKTSPNEELLQAIRTITYGKRYLSPDMEDQINGPLDPDTFKQPHELLSDREREVMSLMSTGRTITEISKDLSLSVKTISTYKCRIFEKLKISNNAHLIMYAFRNHMVN